MPLDARGAIIGNRTVLGVLLAAPLALPAPPGADVGAAAVPVTAGRDSVTVDNETARGWLAYPTDFAPTTLLVFGHGCCGKPNPTAFVKAYAQTYGVAVVAMDESRRVPP